MTGLVREFLEYFDLDFTIAVFDPESNFVSQTTFKFFLFDTLFSVIQCTLNLTLLCNLVTKVYKALFMADIFILVNLSLLK